ASVQAETRTDCQLVRPTVAAEPLRRSALVEIDALVELVLVYGRLCHILIIPQRQAGRRGQIGQREELAHQKLRAFIEAGGWNLVSRIRYGGDVRRSAKPRERILQRSGNRR